MDTTLDLIVCGNPVIINTNYGSLDTAREALELALVKVNAELNYLENQPVSEDIIQHEYVKVWDE